MRTRALLLAATGLTLLATSCGGHGAQNPPSNGTGVPELRNLGQLQAAFNQHPGLPRLIVLVSPTCPTCIIGSSWIRQHVLNAHPRARLSILVVWEPMYPGDSYVSIDPKMFNDPRVRSFWDPHEISGTWFDNHTPGARPDWKIWDAYFAYNKTSNWLDTPTGLVADGHTIIASTGRLQRLFLPLLAPKARNPPHA